MLLSPADMNCLCRPASSGMYARASTKPLAVRNHFIRPSRFVAALAK